MAQKSNPKTPFMLFPFKGMAYFLTHPKYWPLQFIAMFFLMVALLAVFGAVLYFTWPNLPNASWWPETWGIIKSFALASAAGLVGFIVLMPLFLTFALDKMVRRMLQDCGALKEKVGALKSLYSSTVIFFKTLFWRIFWPIVGVLSALFLGPFGLFIAQVGIGHLAVIDGVDLALAMLGKNTKERLILYKERNGQIFCMGVVAGCLSMLLTISILGWLIWVPSVIAGCTLWVLEWKEN